MATDDVLPVRIEELLRHRAWVRALARSLVRDESLAQDLVQDTYAAALARPPAARTSLRGWLATVLRNRLRDRRRVEARRVRREEIAARPEGTASAAELAEEADAHRRLMEAVVALEEPYREVVLLRYYEGLSTAEVAARQGVPASTARTRLQRALDRLRERLGGERERDRRSWAVALLPLLAPDAGPAPTVETAGLGAFLMMHKVKIVAAGLLAVVLVAVLVSAGSPGAPAPAPDQAQVAAGADTTPAAPPPPLQEPAEEEKAEEGEDAPFRLPTTTRADAVPLPIEDAVEIGLGKNREVVLGETRGRLDRFDAGQVKDKLWIAAEKKRDEDHPLKPSELAVLFRADATTPWADVKEAIWLPASPEVRIYKIYWAALRDGKEVGVPVFFPKDRGLAKTKIRLLERLRLDVVLERDAGRTSVRLLDEELGRDEAGLAELAIRLPTLLEAESKLAALIHAAPDVPLEHVVQALDLVPDPYAMHLSSLRSIDLDGLLEADDAEVTDLLRREMSSRSLRFEGDLSCGPEGPSREFWKFTLARLGVDGMIGMFEGLLVPEEEERPWVKATLTRQEHSPGDLYDLHEKIRPSRALALGLARAYLESERKEDCLRGATLVAFVQRTAPRERYTASWWYAETLLLRAYLGYGKATLSKKAVEDALTRCRAYEDLGVLGRSAYREEVTRLRGNAEELAEKLK